MAGLKSLAKETIYGLSSIVGVSYLLICCAVYHFWPCLRSREVMALTNIYVGGAVAGAADAGMETGFFRFANKGEDDPMRVYSHNITQRRHRCVDILALGLLFLQPVADWLEYENIPWYGNDDSVAMDAIPKYSFHLFAL